jgi:negative regulator of sigma E activity
MSKLFILTLACLLCPFTKSMEQAQGDISSWKEFTRITPQELSYQMSQISKAEQDMTKSQLSHIHRDHETLSLYEAILWDTVVSIHMQVEMKKYNVSDATLLPQHAQDELFANARTEYALRIQELTQPLADNDGQQD